MNIVKGCLIELAVEGNFDVIVHGCNCFNTMGAGIAKQIKKKASNKQTQAKTSIKRPAGPSKSQNEQEAIGLTVLSRFWQEGKNAGIPMQKPLRLRGILARGALRESQAKNALFTMVF